MSAFFGEYAGKACVVYADDKLSARLRVLEELQVPRSKGHLVVIKRNPT